LAVARATMSSTAEGISGLQEGRQRRVLAHHAHENRRDVLGGEGGAAEQEEIEHGPQREQVGAPVDRTSEGLLGDM
jgi:hypothetical protein